MTSLSFSYTIRRSHYCYDVTSYHFMFESFVTEETTLLVVKNRNASVVVLMTLYTGVTPSVPWPGSGLRVAEQLSTSPVQTTYVSGNLERNLFMLSMSRSEFIPPDQTSADIFHLEGTPWTRTNGCWFRRGNPPARLMTKV